MATNAVSIALGRQLHSDELTIPKGRVYLPLAYSWRGHNGPVWLDVIEKFPEIANGWERSELQSMQKLLNATPMILKGRLRLMPGPADQMNRELSPILAKRWIERVSYHVDSSRIPIIQQRTLEGWLCLVLHLMIQKNARQATIRIGCLNEDSRF